MPRPPSELSSGMNGDPVCPAPCTTSYSAVRMPRAESRNACAAHWRDGGEPYPPPAMLASSRARDVSNSGKNVAYDVPEVATPSGGGGGKQTPAGGGGPPRQQENSRGSHERNGIHR